MAKHTFRTHVAADFTTAAGQRMTVVQMVSEQDGYAYASAVLLAGHVDDFKAAANYTTEAHAWLAGVANELNPSVAEPVPA